MRPLPRYAHPEIESYGRRNKDLFDAAGVRCHCAFVPSSPCPPSPSPTTSVCSSAPCAGRASVRGSFSLDALPIAITGPRKVPEG